MRTNLYVDGFNLYHRVVKGTPYKWLDVRRLAELIVKNADIQRTRYFTARVSARPDDPYIAARQDTYLRALLTIAGLSIHEGRFQSHPRRLPIHPAPASGPKTIEVLYTEEKGSDVNLASFLLIDAFREEFEQAIVISNDSDLCTPIEFVVSDLGLPVIVLAPHRQPSGQLRRVASAQWPIRQGPLQAAQFPERLIATNGRVISRPAGW